MTTATFDPFELTDDLPDAADKFRPSLVARARKRDVIEKGECWIVAGDKSLGDSFNGYIVKLDGRRYHCSCYGHGGGQYRSHKVCSHVLAVILFRQDQRRGRGGSDQGALVRPPEVTESWPPTLATIPSPADARFGTPALPSWVSSFRPHQWQAVEEIIAAFETNDVVFLDAPTGAGKTLIAELARRLMKARAVYVCSTKTLQDQILRDFPYAKLLKGRANYDTILGPPGVTCGDCTHTRDHPACAWCRNLDSCPYQRAKRAAEKSDLAVLNTAYFLAKTNYVDKVDDPRPQLVIVDECDLLEKELMGFVEVVIGERRMKELKVGMPEKVTKPESWAVWLEGTVIPAVQSALEKIPVSDIEDVRKVRNRKALAQLLAKLLQVAPGIASGNWVFDGYNTGKAIFRSVRVDDDGRRVLWQHGKKWLCMSATIISSDELVDSLGYKGDYATVRVPMTFPVENRPIRVAPIANMKNSEKEAEWPKAIAATKAIVNRHPGERVLVHTVSYELARSMFNAAKDWGRPRFMYTDAAGREQALAEYRDTEGAVIFAPSLDRGVSFDDDQCRVVVVAKVPFPNLGDKQVNARLHSKNGQAWYSVLTVRSLVQSTGRGVRSKDDWCETYIIDRQFVSNTLKKSRSLLPSWWLEALDLQFQTTQLKESA